MKLFAEGSDRQARNAYTMECAFEYHVSLLVTDSFLAVLLGSLGFTDSEVGVLSSLISLAFLFQLVAVPLARKFRGAKPVSLLFHGLSRLPFITLYILPMMDMSDTGKRIAAVICLLITYFCSYFVSPTMYKWGNSFVPLKERGMFSATKEMISLATGLAVSLGAGVIMQRYTDMGDLYGGFLFASVAILCFSICDMVCIMLMRDKPQPAEEAKTPFKIVLKNTLGNKGFVTVLIFYVLVTMACYNVTGFLGTYKVGELGITLTLVQIINIIGCTGRLIFSRPFGRMTDRTSFLHTAKFSLVLTAVSFAILIFTKPDTWWLMIGYVLLFNIAQAGLNANLTNVTYSYVDEKYFVEATAIKNSVGGLCGFGMSVVAGRFLAMVQGNGNTFLGVQAYGQQVLAIGSVFLAGIAILLATFCLKDTKADK